ncbi:MAG: hypothetical protein ACREOX_02145, partial [Stenotrophomonas sp.]
MDGTTQRLDSPSPRLQRLLDYIDADPTNLALIGDAAKRAADDGRYVECDTLLNRYEQLQPLAPALMNLRAVSALSQG